MARDRVLRLLEEYDVGREYTPWWSLSGEDDYLEPRQLLELGLSKELIEDGRAWSREWEAWAMATMEADEADQHRRLRRRGVELARRTVEEAPDLWVLDPAGDWCIGREALSFPRPAREEFQQDAHLLLGVPANAEDTWPWRFQPAYSVPGDEWGVPLPTTLGWGREIEATTAAYVQAMAAATDRDALVEAWHRGRLAMEAMVAATGWMGDAFQPVDTTGRTAQVEVREQAWPLLRALRLKRRLKRFAKRVPAPPTPEQYGWFAYAPLSGETFRGR